MFRLQRSIGQTLVPVVGFVAFANLGCGTSIAANYPHLDRRSVCLLVPGIERDATEFVFTEHNVPVSNFHPEVVDQVATTARTVFGYDPNADPSSPRWLPAPYNQLQCPRRVSWLPSREPQASPLPDASLELVVHEPRPEIVPRAVTEKLAKCLSQSSGQLTPIEHAMAFNVYVTNEGQTVSALVAQSTLGNRQTEACMVGVLRTTSWPGASVATSVAAAPLSKLFFAQPAPVLPPPDSGPASGIRRIQPPVVDPGGGRIPRIFVIPLGSIAAAGVVFGIIFFWSDNDAPAWASEMNPITRQPYTSLQEHDEVRRLSPQEILQRQQAHITNTQSQPPPAPAPAPAPDIKAQREQEKKAQRCAKIAKDIDDLIYTKREETTGDFPNGYQGLAKRWWEYATNEGKWGYTLEGKLGKRPANHLAEYRRQQGRLVNKLRDEWYANDKECEKMGHTLPSLAGQYAAQEPQLGPGKPLVPAPTPIYSPATSPALSVPQAKKPSQ